jgi:hypothetical protein
MGNDRDTTRSRDESVAGSWTEYRKFVVNELKHLTEAVDKLSAKVESLEERQRKFEIQMTKKLAVLGGIVTVIAAAVGEGVRRLFHFAVH